MINIRSIQHYMYCPRRFALLEINEDWAENVFVVKANIMHDKVHSAEHIVRSANKIELSSVVLYNDELELYGVADCVEFTNNIQESYIKQLDGRYSVKVIEYKPKRPKEGYNETDAIQVFAQKLCADSIFGCRSSGAIYYSDVRKRVELPFEEKYDYYMDLLKRLTDGMNECIQNGYIPNKRRDRNCSGCSLSDVCFPKNTEYSVKKIISEAEEVCENF